MNRISQRDRMRQGIVRTRGQRSRHREDGVADLEAEAVVLCTYMLVSCLTTRSKLRWTHHKMRISGSSNL